MSQETVVHPPTKKNFLRIIALRSAHRRAWCDLKLHGQRGALWTLAFAIFCGLLYVLGNVLSLYSAFGVGACQPDGSFSMDPFQYRYWSASGFFQITLGFGDLSFTAAKAIDICWDVGFGRGGQALLAFMSWRVFAKYVTTCMHVAPITFNSFRTIFLHNEATVLSIPRLVRDFSRRHSLQSKVASIFMVATLIFILVFPTFGSAMTGYSGNVQSVVHDSASGVYIPFKNFEYLYYVIHDGDRIGKEKEFAVTTHSVGYDESVLSDGSPLDNCDYDMNDIDYPDDCAVLNNVTAYIRQYGLRSESPKNISSTFMNYNLSATTLNIAIYPIPTSYFTAFRQALPSDIDLPFGPEKRMHFKAATGGEVYDQNYMLEQGSCQAVKTYQWGFSYVQLNLMIMLLLIWMIGIYLMWLRAHIVSKRRGTQDSVGEYKAIFALAYAMQAQLEETTKEEGQNVSTLTEAQLRRRITKDLSGGSISYKSSLLHEEDGEDVKADTTGWGFKAWWKEEMWWIIGMLVALVGWIVPVVYSLYVIFAWVLPLVWVFVMVVSSSGRVRAVLLFWPLLVLGAVPTIVFSLMSVQTNWDDGY